MNEIPNNKDHRLENRTKAEFSQDIKKCHIAEAIIACRICISEHHIKKQWPILKPTGVDYTGKFIENIQEINSYPDFSIDGNLVEITKSSNVLTKTFHWKVHKVKHAINEGYYTVFVNGFNQLKQPDYICVGPIELKELTQRSITKYGEVWLPTAHSRINKPAYRYDIYWIKDLFRPLPILIKNLPNEYKQILDSVL